jgi:uncharacterized protein with PQ loop repeat
MSSNNDIAVTVNKIQAGLFCCRLTALLKVKPGILAWSPACLWHRGNFRILQCVLVVQGPPIFGNFIKLPQTLFEVWSDTAKECNFFFFFKDHSGFNVFSFYSETFARNFFHFHKHLTCHAEGLRETGLGLHAKYSFLLYDFDNLSVLINFRRNLPIKKILANVFNGSRVVVCQQT